VSVAKAGELADLLEAVQATLSRYADECTSMISDRCYEISPRVSEVDLRASGRGAPAQPIGEHVGPYWG